MTGPSIGVRRLPHAADLPLPSYMTDGAAGADVVAAVEADLVIAPGARALVPTGLSLAIPPGYEVQVRPRSGLALRHGLTLMNAPGTIDTDFRGEVGVVLANLGEEPFTVRRGERIAQLVVAPALRVQFDETDRVEATERGEKGFGSTGT